MRGRALRETLVRRTVRYRGKILDLLLDTVRLPGGGTALREIVRHAGAVAVVPLAADGQVALVEQYRHALGRVTRELPAGKLDRGETPLACAKRELREETGLAARRFVRLTTLATTPGFTDERIHLFLATGLSRGAARPDADEFVRLVWATPAQARDAVARGAIYDAKTVAGLLLALGGGRGRPGSRGRRGWTSA